LLPTLVKAKCVAKNATCQSAIKDLCRAFETYETDFGIYPSDPGWGTAGKAADTKVFVKCMQARGPKFTSYYTFQEDDLKNGEFISPHESVYKYTFPAGTVQAGPDGMKHTGVSYLLWTRGCLGNDPEIDWENNNWSK
jgi:hypothetical protein